MLVFAQEYRAMRQLLKTLLRALGTAMFLLGTISLMHYMVMTVIRIWTFDLATPNLVLVGLLFLGGIAAGEVEGMYYEPENSEE